jgi:hypothetical protein
MYPTELPHNQIPVHLPNDLHLLLQLINELLVLLMNHLIGQREELLDIIELLAEIVRTEQHHQAVVDEQ